MFQSFREPGEDLEKAIFLNRSKVVVKTKIAFLSGLVSLLLLVGPSVAEEKVPLSRVLLTVIDLKASAAKVALARYYVGRAVQGHAQHDSDWREAAARSLEAALFYVDSSLELSQGELRRDLEKLRSELKQAGSWIGREPSEILEELEGLERGIGEVLGGIDRISRTYKGTQGWTASWTGRDGLTPSGAAVPSK